MRSLDDEKVLIEDDGKILSIQSSPTEDNDDNKHKQTIEDDAINSKDVISNNLQDLAITTTTLLRQQQQQQPEPIETQQEQPLQSQQQQNNNDTPSVSSSLCGTHHAQLQQRPRNAFAESSLVSKIFFSWPYPLLKLGMERPLIDSDIPDVLQSDTSQVLLEKFKIMWKKEQLLHPKSPSLRRAIIKDFFINVWYIQPFMALGAASKIIQAIALGKLIDYFTRSTSNTGTDDDDINNDSTNSSTNGYVWASVVVLCGAIVLFEHHHVFFVTWRKGMQYRSQFVAAIHDKSLRLSSIYQDSNKSNFGHIMNLASNDVERFILASLFASYLIWAPIQSIGILFVGYYTFGPAFAVGFALLALVFVPLQIYLGGKFAFYRSKIAAITDKRVNFVSQAVRGARVMKMSGYEYRFLEQIMDYRKQEVSKILKANNLKAWNEALFFAANVVISLVIFLAHVLMGGTLKAGDVFAVFTLINILQLEMTKHVALGVMGTSELYVSLGRIQKFLEFPELEETGPGIEQLDRSNDTSADEQTIAIAFDNVTCYWNEMHILHEKINGELTDDSSHGTSLLMAIQDVSFSCRLGEVTAIIGSVGSGKSALIQAIVKELPISKGIVKRRYNSMAYAPQDPWIMDGSVKENILMGLDYDEEWYNQVVQACGLSLDFQQFHSGDLTVLGDRGVQCSGGQRARIGCARAIYRNADVLVLDDPLSAVDARVGRQLFQEAIHGLAVTRGKCVILATHQHQYVSECNCILVMEGQIQYIGAYEDCVQASNGKLTAHAADDVIDGLDSSENSVITSKSVTTDELSGDDEFEKEADKQDLVDSDEDNKEKAQKGIVTVDTYVNYVRAMGGLWVGLFLFILFCITQASVLFTIATVGQWAERPAADQDDWEFIGLVIGLGCTVVVLSLIRVYISFQLTIKASQTIHDNMAKAVLRAKIQFFDTNPLGRILNRFSADVGITDDQLPPTLFDFFMLAFVVLGAVVTAVSTLPFILLALPFILWYFVWVRKIFVTSSRELKRLEGIARSPIYSMVSESLGGIATIRANNSVDFFRHKFREFHDSHTRAFFAFMSSSRWVGFRMDALVFLLLAAVSFLAVLFSTEGWFDVNPAILGLSLSLLIQLAGLFQWCIRQSAEVVNQFVSVERILEFGKVEPEAELEYEDDNKLLSTGWPKEGSIEVEHLSARYRDSLPLTLVNVSFVIPQGARVGIVGRTGSGESTIVQTLFRLLEADSGRIIIDGVDVSKIGLHALRTKISVIPQVPTLFSGCTVRENLDLFAIHSDDSVKQVLGDCHMLAVIDELPNGWDTLVAEGGSNFSVGQRQLLCLARSILSKNRILIMDESTANVDRRTDQLLQEALQKSFKDGTILAIAHRLDTIIDFDLVLVLGGGHLLEFGTPADLIRSSGPFAAMVNDTGETMSKDLRQRAFQKEAQAKLQAH